VFCEARTVEEVTAAIERHQISCAGLVPSILASLEPRSLPSLQVVFTWGEALQARTAMQWASAVHLIDLLIASEYWLTLYADWSDWTQSSSRTGTRPPFRAVTGAAVLLLPNSEAGEPAPEPAAGHPVKTGELLVRGPQVTPGYLGDERRNAKCFLEGWYRTSDCLTEMDGGYKFAGRADDMVKVAGNWVDTRQICESLRDVDGVADAHMHSKAAFVALARFEGSALPTLRRRIPADHALFVVPSLPRNDVTGKVDRRRLDTLTGRGTSNELGADLRERRDQLAKLDEFKRWYLMLVVLLFWPAYDLVAALGEDSAWPWVVATADLLGACLRVWLLTYLFLSYLYHDQLAKYCMYAPFGHVGLFCFIAGLVPLWFLALLALDGMWKAYRRQRFCSWPCVALLCFPRWSYLSGCWWLTSSVSRILDWYWNSLLQQMPIGLKRCLGHAKTCHSCKQLSDRGRIDLSVDKHWYCDSCWKHYNAHWQCARCRAWVTRGKQEAEGRQWICFGCARQAAAPAAVTAPAPASPAPSAAAPSASTPVAGGAEAPERGNGESPLVKRQRVDAQRRVEHPWVSSYTGAASSTQVARTLSPGPSGAANGSRSPSRPTSVPAEARSPYRPPSQGPSSGSPTRPAVASRPGTPRQTDRELAPQWRFGTPTVSDAIVHEETAHEKGHLWQLIEDVTDFRFAALEEQLASIDSMRWQRLTSRLRRQEGRSLPFDAQKRCSTLGDLIREIEQLPVVDGSEQPREVEEEVAGWFMMWRSRCQWTIQIRRPVSDDHLRKAVEELMWRHSSLRACAADKDTLFREFQICLSILQLWRMWLMDSDGYAVSVCRRAMNLFAWAVDSAWPRLRFNRAEVGKALTILPRCATPEAAQEAAAAGNKVPWAPPFQAIAAPYGEHGSEDQNQGVMMVVKISHMLSDGFCIVPLMSDLAMLLVNLDAQAQGQIPRPLPALDSALSVLRQRISRTVQGDHSGSDAVSPQVLDASSGAKVVHAQFLDLPPKLVMIIKQAALKLAVPDEILLLTAIGVSIAKMHSKETQTLQMVIPGRDGPCESDLVALFAEYRRLEVRTAGLSYAGVALSLHYLVKERRWRQPPSVKQSEAPFVNFEWTDFEERHGVSQIAEARHKDTNVHSPLHVVALSPSRDRWRLLTSMRGDRYTEPDLRRIADFIEDALRCLIEEPLTLVNAT